MRVKGLVGDAVDQVLIQLVGSRQNGFGSPTIASGRMCIEYELDEVNDLVS